MFDRIRHAVKVLAPLFFYAKTPPHPPRSRSVVCRGQRYELCDMVRVSGNGKFPFSGDGQVVDILMGGISYPVARKYYDDIRQLEFNVPCPRVVVLVRASPTERRYIVVPLCARTDGVVKKVLLQNPWP